MDMTIRAATKDGSRALVELFQMAAGGVADYIWQGFAEAGETLLDVGTRRFARENEAFSYQNCRIAEVGGETAGMICAYAMGEPEPTDQAEAIDPVLAPYDALEEPHSFYVAGIACYDDRQGAGVGSRLLAEAEDRARAAALEKLSLIAFEENRGSVRLYERIGYVTTARRAIVLHELIRYGGDTLLMVRMLESV